MSKHAVVVNLNLAIEEADLIKLAAALTDQNLGLHLVNTLVNHAGLNEAQFRGLSFDLNVPQNG